MSKSNFIDEILDDPSFTAEEQKVIRRFSQAAMRMASNSNVTNSASWNMSTVSSEAGVDLDYPKEGMVMVALWCIFYHHTRAHYPVARLKYPNVGAFLSTYRGRFADCGAHGQEQLKDIANLLNIMYSLLPPRKNKGLCIQVAPKVIEGWFAKYVTGSGQTKATADRVYIFETEGNVQPCHRGGRMAVTAPLRRPQTPSSKKRVIKKTSNPKFHSTVVPERKALKKAFSFSLHSRNEHVMTRRGSKEELSSDCLDQLAFSPSFTSALGDTGMFTFPDGLEYPEPAVCDESPDSPRGVAHEAHEPHEADEVHPMSSALVVSTGGALNGHFQPLFDFGILGPAGKMGLSAPPLLKRAYSWESTCGRDTENEQESQTNTTITPSTLALALAPVPTQRPMIERTVSIGPLKDFLFDSYLSTTNAATTTTAAVMDEGK